MLPRQSISNVDALMWTLYVDHGEALLAYATRLTRDRQVAGDVVRETLLRVWRQADARTGELRSAQAWLHAVAREVATDRSWREPGGQAPDPVGPPPIPDRCSVSAVEHAVLIRRAGQMWRVEMGSRGVLVPDNIGTRYLESLLANPGREIAAIDLVASRGSADRALAGGLPVSDQPVLDDRAKREYRAKLAELQFEIDEHEANNDVARAEQVRAQHARLVAELTSAVGLGGRTRTFTGAEERARIAVGKAIRRAINRIHAVDPAVGEALRVTVRTGIRCSYRMR